MTEEVQAPVVEPAAPVVPETPAAEGEQVAAPVEQAEAEKPKQKPWFQTRIDQLTQQKYAEKQRADALEAQLRAAPPIQHETITEQAPAFDKNTFDRMVQERAAAVAKEQKFNEECNRVYNAGMKEIPDFQQALGNFEMLGGLGSHPELVEIATSMPEGHKVLHYLASNLDEAARVINLTPVKMAMEIAKLSTSMKEKPISGAPRPVAALKPGGGESVAGPDENGNFASHADFKRWREANRKKA